jgi:copper chaperone CopZ
MCEKKFSSNVPYFKGITDFSYDMATSKITVTFNPKKTTIEEIRKGISDLGYDADGVKANVEARAKLPACCRKAGAHDADAKSQTGGCGHKH